MDQRILDNYFLNQAGTGLVAYSGPKYQRGHGFNFGKILRKLKPALRYIGKHGLCTLTNIGKDLLEGENFAETAKSHLKTTGKRIAGEMINKADSYLDQSGGGLIIKRRKKYKMRKTKAKTDIKSKRTKKVTKKKPVIKRKSVRKVKRKKKKITKLNFL